jgi:hypothetical protein
MTKNQQDLRLLSKPYKKVALGILLFSTLILILSISKTLPIDKDIAKIISKTGLLVSLLLFALTKNKIEDELTSRIRLKAFAGTFIFGVVLVIVQPFVNLLFQNRFLSEKGASEILISMFIFYFIIFYYTLKNR